MLSRVHLAFHAWIQDFSSGGGEGGPGQSDKKVLTRGGGGGGGDPTFSRGSNCLYNL